MSIKVLYCGDSPVGGAANYLLGVLHSMRARVVHLPPAEKLRPAHLRQDYDVIIFSDYSKSQVDAVSERLVTAQVESGAGFLMIGGWGSYSGPFGGWKGSLIEKLLPVVCKNFDDRTNFPGGASVVLKKSYGFLKAQAFKQTPAICGLNSIHPKSDSKTLLAARQIISNGKKIRLASKEYPLLVVDSQPDRRVAALATDLAPHWCGGLVDWGNKTLKLSVTPRLQIQVGNDYVQFISSLLRWLAG